MIDAFLIRLASLIPPETTLSVALGALALFGALVFSLALYGFAVLVERVLDALSVSFAHPAKSPSREEPRHD